MDLFTPKDKVVVITGSSGLLGREYANAVASAGGIPVLLDLIQEVLDKQADQNYSTFGVTTKGYSVNIRDVKAVDENCIEILSVFGKIDGLVFNAANNPKVKDQGERNFSRLEFFLTEVWEKDLFFGLKGSFLCIKYYGYQLIRNIAG